jgi:deazaflavin-dependent oxidoreductase (nitroreductase family)
MKYQQHLLNRIRVFNKQALNPMILKFAGCSHSPISVIRHAGRRSGKPYLTPIIVEPLVDGFVFALTYGPKVDWYRNVLAAGWCTVIWHGKEYVI